MGSDNLFHKRKARKPESLRRLKAKRAPYDLVLIVCEGGNTEPNYFRELRDAFRLNTANIEIVGEECGSAPRNVVSFAIEKYKQEKEYDRVYCVFDKDRHPTYNEALDRVHNARLGRGHTIHAITSVPCFEIWLLLHFHYTTRGFGIRGAGTSICDEVIEQLQRDLPGYTKGMQGLFRRLQGGLDQAIQNAARLKAHNLSAGTDNPSTEVDRLVEYLRDLNK
jgi:hypothetical protein